MRLRFDHKAFVMPVQAGVCIMIWASMAGFPQLGLVGRRECILGDLLWASIWSTTSTDPVAPNMTIHVVYADAWEVLCRLVV